MSVSTQEPASLKKYSTQEPSFEFSMKKSAGVYNRKQLKKLEF